jgi:ribose transport system substrate-binding protein
MAGVAIAGMAGASGLAGCSGTSSGSSANSGLVPLKNITIGYSVSTLTNAFFVGLTQGVQRETKALGVKLIFDNANGDPSTQANQVDDLVAHPVNAIILNPVDAQAIIPAVQAANKANIPVITLDRTSSGGTIKSFVQVSSVAMAEAAANWLATQLKARYGSYKGRIVDMEGLMSTSTGVAREQGFEDAIKKYPGIQVVSVLAGNFDSSTAYDEMTDASAGRQIDGVFNADDDNAIGVERAISVAGLAHPIGSAKHIFITGMDGSAQALAAIRSGEQDMTESQNPLREAEVGVQLAVEVLEGKSLPKEIYYPSQFISTANIDSGAVTAYGLWSVNLSNTGAGNIADMKALPIYNGNAKITGMYSSLYKSIS